MDLWFTYTEARSVLRYYKVFFLKFYFTAVYKVGIVRIIYWYASIYTVM